MPGIVTVSLWYTVTIFSTLGMSISYRVQVPNEP